MAVEVARAQVDRARGLLTDREHDAVAVAGPFHHGQQDRQRRRAQGQEGAGCWRGRVVHRRSGRCRVVGVTICIIQIVVSMSSDARRRPRTGREHRRNEAAEGSRPARRAPTTVRRNGWRSDPAQAPLAATRCSRARRDGAAPRRREGQPTSGSRNTEAQSSWPRPTSTPSRPAARRVSLNPAMSARSGVKASMAAAVSASSFSATAIWDAVGGKSDWPTAKPR